MPSAATRSGTQRLFHRRKASRVLATASAPGRMVSIELWDGLSTEPPEHPAVVDGLTPGEMVWLGVAAFRDALRQVYRQVLEKLGIDPFRRYRS